MVIHPARYTTRSVSLVLLAAFGGLGLWLFAPWGGGGSGADPGSGRPGDANASATSSVRVDGPVRVESHDDVVTRLVVPLALRGDESFVFVEDDGGMRAETAMSESASASVPAAYAVSWLDGNGDGNLDPGEHVLLTVDLPEHTSVHPGNPLRLVLHPAGGTTLVIEDVLP